MAFQNPIDIEVVDIKIRKPDGSNEKSIKLLCINLEVVESLVSPNICGSMSISDSTNFYNDYPLTCLLYTSPSPRDKRQSRMPSSA